MAHFEDGSRFDSGVRFDEPDPEPLTRKRMKVKLGLDRMTVEQKITFGKAVVAAMNKNAVAYPNANPSPAALGALVTQAEASLAASNAADETAKNLRVVRDQNLAALCAGLTAAASFVDSVANGDPAVITLFGLEVRNGTTPIGPMPQVMNLVLTAGDHDGTMDVMWDPIRGAKSYEIWLSPDPMSEASWKFVKTGGKSSITLKGLTSGSRIWVRVRAIGADPDPGPWSDPATKIVP